jgi:hypothetical protein
MGIPVKIMKKPSEKKPNELNARASFITILKSLTDIEYVASGSPDEENRCTKDIDFVLVSSINERDKIAVEHTTVQSFDGQIEYLNRSWDIVGSVNDGCRERIPGDRYYSLAVPPAIVDSLVTKRSRELFVSYLSSWVADTAPKLLLVDSYEQKEYEGHRITLMCLGDATEQLNGKVGRMPEAPEDQKARQRERLGRAVNAKLPKLTKYKEQGFKTALLLEDVAGTLPGSTLSGYGLEEVDYVVVFVSNEDRMIIGNVWKEGSVWYSSVPGNRKFKFPREPQHKSATRVFVE